MVDEENIDIKSLQTAFNVVEIIQERDGATVSTVAEELDKPVSTVNSHLRTLRELRYVNKDGKEYTVGLRFLDHGMYARDKLPLLEAANQPLQELAEETGETGYLMVEDHGKGIYVEEAFGENAIETRGRIGKHTHLHILAAGKAILAELDQERVDEIIDRHGLPAYTENSITDRDELFENLKEIRERGYAINNNEEVDGIRAVGSAIVVDDNVKGSLSISGPSQRFEEQGFRETFSDKVLSATNTIELKMQY